MKTRMQTACVITLSLMLAAVAQAEMDFVVDIRPATILVSSSSDDFEAVTPSDPSLGAPFRDKEDAGQISSMPTLRLGVGWDSDRSYLNLTGGIGYMINERYQSPFLNGDVAWHWKYRKNVSMGPHAGLYGFFDPEWHGDADVSLDETVGYMLGFEVAIGYDILFVFSVDYLSAQFDADARLPTLIADDDDELDISGIAFQFGMRGNF